MYRDGSLDKLLRSIKRLIPRGIFDSLAPHYHRILAWTGALAYRFPSRKLEVIGVTGTKGKSTVVLMIAKLLEGAGYHVAAVGSLGYKIMDKEWPNLLKMTMPGRWKIQKFLRRALDAGCTHVVMEAPSEGLAQGRHLGVMFDCAVFTNLHPEHIEAHGSLDAYRSAKRILFDACRRFHVINADDPLHEYYGAVSADKKIFYGIEKGDMRATDLCVRGDSVSFSVYGTRFNLVIGGKFNVYNALSALAVAALYGIDLPFAKPILEGITEIPGRMQWIQKKPFGVVVDYAHTPDSLMAVYETFSPKVRPWDHKVSPLQEPGSRLICVLGAAGGGRDRWKRPEFGRIAERYCDRIILTNEDPYDEAPEKIIDDIMSGISAENRESKVKRVQDRGEAIRLALTEARPGDIVVITGKGSETSIALAGGRKVPWSDAQTVRDVLQGRG